MKGSEDGWVGGWVSECKARSSTLPAWPFLPSPPQGKLTGQRDQKTCLGPHNRSTLVTATSKRSRERKRNGWEEALNPVPAGVGGVRWVGGAGEYQGTFGSLLI